jgi:hypothetical protein
MNKRILIFSAVMALLLWSVFAAVPRVLADDPNRLTQLRISVWPEHDKPSVLVMIDGTLADKTNLPREVSVLIPANASLLVTTWMNPDGNFEQEQPSQSKDLGDGYVRVSLTTAQPNYHVEYYHDLLKGAPDKTMDFVFKAPAPADQVTLEFQQPLKTSNFSVTPATQSSRSDSDGFKYFSSQYSNITAGQTITAQVKYTKTDPNPSVLPTPASSLATSSTPTSTASATFLLVALVVMGLAAVLGFFAWQQRAREEPLATKMTPRQYRRNKRRARPAVSSASVFCTQCGRALGPEDNFCPKCGTKRRGVE